MSTVLAIGDTHEPVCLPGYLDFCRDTYNQWGCDRAVHIGDIADWHCCSRFPKELDAPGPTEELKLTRKRLKQWSKAFGENLDVCLGNHCLRLLRAAYSLGMPAEAIRTLNEIFETKFNFQDMFIIDGVVYTHGEDAGSGKFPALNYASQLGSNVVIGHYHTIGGVQHSANKVVQRFGCHTGCGVDQDAAAMRYSVRSKAKAVHGCAVIVDGTPIFEPMSDSYKS